MEIDALISKLEREIESTQKDADKAASLARLKEIHKYYKGEDELVSFDEIAERIKNEPEEVKIMSGWKGLDDILKGFRPEQLIVVSALTKSGKTSFLMDLTCKVKELNPMWLPFEESATELVRKFLERGETPPHAYSPSLMKSSKLSVMDWVESKIIESVAKFNTKVVFIDQLDFIVSFNSDNHALRVGQAMRDLKAMAKRWGVTIFLICHLVKARMDSQPTLEDLKGSSSIGQEADTVILLWRETKRINGQVMITDNVNISIQANRRTGATGNVKMVYKNGHFFELDWHSDEEVADSDFNNL